MFRGTRMPDCLHELSQNDGIRNLGKRNEYLDLEFFSTQTPCSVSVLFTSVVKLMAAFQIFSHLKFLLLCISTHCTLPDHDRKSHYRNSTTCFFSRKTISSDLSFDQSRIGPSGFDSFALCLFLHFSRCDPFTNSFTNPMFLKTFH